MPFCQELARQYGVDVHRPIVCQVSRFDPWKDPVGVIEAFRIVRERVPDAQLLLAGSMATDDPEGFKVWEETEAARAGDRDIYLLVEPAPGRVGAGQRVPAHRQRRPAEVVARGLRPHRQRGALEGTAGRRRPRRRHQAADPRRVRRLSRRLDRRVRATHHRPPRRSRRRRRARARRAASTSATTSSRPESSKTGYGSSPSCARDRRLPPRTVPVLDRGRRNHRRQPGTGWPRGHAARPGHVHRHARRRVLRVGRAERRRSRRAPRRGEAAARHRRGVRRARPRMCTSSTTRSSPTRSCGSSSTASST